MLNSIFMLMIFLNTQQPYVFLMGQSSLIFGSFGSL